MTEQNLDWQYRQPVTPPKKKGWRIRHVAAAYALGGIILGLVIGGSTATHETVTRDVPGPERIVNHDVTVNVPTTPAECATAIDLYEQLTDYTSEALGYTQDAMVAASTFDAAGINKATANVKTLTPKIQALGDPLKAAKAACRAAK